MREQDSRAARDDDNLPGHVLEVLGLELGRGETHTVLRLCPRLLLRLESPRVGTEEERDTPKNRTLDFTYIHVAELSQVCFPFSAWTICYDAWAVKMTTQAREMLLTGRSLPGPSAERTYGGNDLNATC